MSVAKTIPSKPNLDRDSFITGSPTLSLAEAPKAARALKYDKKFFQLEITDELRRAIRVEAILAGYSNVSTYICEILVRRGELVGK